MKKYARSMGGRARTEPDAHGGLVLDPRVIFDPPAVRVPLEYDPALEPQAHLAVAEETSKKRHEQLRRVTYMQQVGVSRADKISARRPCLPWNPMSIK